MLADGITEGQKDGRSNILGFRGYLNFNFRRDLGAIVLGLGAS